MGFGETAFTVTDVKHYAYCPTIIYIKYVLGVKETTTEYMKMGREIHYEKKILPIIAKYKPLTVEKTPYLACKKLSFSGIPDYLLVTSHGYGVIVEVKWAEPSRSGIKKDHKLQLGAYALLAERSKNIVVRKGVVYYLKPQPKLYEITITGKLLKEAEKIMKKIKEIVVKGAPPNPKISWRKCKGCNYTRYCPTPAKKPAQTHRHNPRKRL
ncbi:MAG: CRISPR-associated protein Cas4 [Thermoprotei archaeon]|nr:MAG: CRISPR-associated protein Cas4 [Thermoprotei archaeon]